MKKTIVVATGNLEKLAEIRSILPEYEIKSVKDFNIPFFVEEDEDTFEGNSLKKAKTLADYLQVPCIADDSGLCIQKFGGWPGVKTKRWRRGSDNERNQEIIEKMQGVPKEERGAEFVTAIAYADADEIFVETERISGYISTEIRGSNGFGFDPIFELEDGRTLSELSVEEKNAISSRKKCLEKIKPFLSR